MIPPNPRSHTPEYIRMMQSVVSGRVVGRGAGIGLKTALQIEVCYENRSFAYRALAETKLIGFMSSCYCVWWHRERERDKDRETFAF